MPPGVSGGRSRCGTGGRIGHEWGGRRVGGRIMRAVGQKARCNAGIHAEVCHNPISYSFCLPVCHARLLPSDARRQTSRTIQKIPKTAAAETGSLP